MSLVFARRASRLGIFFCPLSCLASGLLVLKWPGPGMALAAALAAALWIAFRRVGKKLARACSSASDNDEQLFQSQKLMALGEISTGIAHEINNPLNIIMQESELMRMNIQELPADENLEDIQSSINVVCRQVERCSDITHKLLDFARNRKPVSQDADINRLVEDMLALVEREIGSKDILVVRSLQSGLPTLKTDPPLVRQVLLNLIINAVQALGEEGVILVSTFRADGMVCTEIRDTGPGIAPELQERIFNPFYTTKPPGQGTGLGLSVSLRIINQLGGDILVRSAPGKGAAFTVRLPQ
ncbi:sensor histidine kinase [Salidesulfovibrio onnuriiensis]|uniref:sensor histidine kinase n=1 Tax=Salidesulfovibrio onnuriiensis TaxID=2583823 RepID=UPI0011CCA728|nr:ATP-binding protein [Salidesulfovibrio onnuriiensis]